MSLHHEKNHPRLCAAYFRHDNFLWRTWHVIFLHTKFPIAIKISHVAFFQCVWIKPHSSNLTNVESLTSNFGQSVQICCREKEENNSNCKAFCVTRKRKKKSSIRVELIQITSLETVLGPSPFRTYVDDSAEFSNFADKQDFTPTMRNWVP